MSLAWRIENSSLRLAAAATAAVLAALTIAIHGSAVHGWWRWDDTVILKNAIEYRPWQYFFVPAAWQDLNTYFFTPWLNLTYAMDFALFGARPSAFYAHLLVSIWLSAVALYMLLRLWLSRFWSAACAVLFVVGAPAAVISEQLMSRHYADGMVFALLALYLYVRSLREDRRLKPWVAGLLYLLAVSAKEIYVPLVGLLLFLPETTLSRRLRKAVPFFLVAILYVPWRAHMLGAFVGGYGHEIPYRELLALPGNAARFLFGHGALAAAAVLMVLAAAITVSWRSLRALLLIAVIAFLLIYPLTYISPDLGPEIVPSPGRYLWTVFLALCVMVAFAAERASRRFGTAPVALVLAGALLLPTVLQTRLVRLEMAPHHQKLEAYGRFVWDHDGPGILWVDWWKYPAWYLEGLRWLRFTQKGQASEVKIAQDEILLQNLNANRVFGYEPDCKCIRDITARVPQMLSEWRAKIRVVPLHVHVKRLSPELIAWDLGPYQAGDYYIIGQERFGKWQIAQVGRWRLKQDQFHSWIRYDSPEGWTTYSDLIQLDLNQTPVYAWRRP